LIPRLSRLQVVADGSSHLISTLIVSNERAKVAELGREKSLASCTDQIARKSSRYLGHDTGECEASFPLCRFQLNSSKVTGTVLQA